MFSISDVKHAGGMLSFAHHRLELLYMPWSFLCSCMYYLADIILVWLGAGNILPWAVEALVRLMCAMRGAGSLDAEATPQLMEEHMDSPIGADTASQRLHSRSPRHTGGCQAGEGCKLIRIHFTWLKIQMDAGLKIRWQTLPGPPLPLPGTPSFQPTPPLDSPSNPPARPLDHPSRGPPSPEAQKTKK